MLAIIFFSMQLYLDWTGCMDIARGVSQIFGIELERNSGILIFQKTCRSFGEDGTLHLEPGLRIIYFIRFQCRSFVNQLTDLQERSGAISIKSIFNSNPCSMRMDCNRYVAWSGNVLRAMGCVSWNLDYTWSSV